MAAVIVRESDIELRKLPGRDLKTIISKSNAGAEEMIVNMVWIKPKQTSKPCHAHLDEEEVVYILEGKGKCYVDGDIRDVRKGDFVLLPKKSKHMFRNTGDRALKLLCVIAPPSLPENYQFYPEIEWKKM